MYYGPHLYHAPPLVLPERDDTALFSRNPQKVRPEANGSVAWTPSAGTNFECVNETGEAGTQQTTSRDFSGTGQYGGRSDGCGITDYPCTVAMWVRPDALTGLNMGFGFASSGNSARQIIWFKATGVVSVSNEADEEANTTNTISTGSWHHVVGIFTSATSRRAVANGSWANSGTNTASVTWPGTVATTRVGADYWNDNEFDGQIAHVAVWNSALSQANVEALAAGANPLTIAAGSLVAYWPMPGVASPEPDEAGTYDLTLTGSPAQGGSAPDVDPPVEAKNTDYITAASAGLLDSFDVPTYDDPAVTQGFIVRYAVPDAPTGGAGVQPKLLQDYSGLSRDFNGTTQYGENASFASISYPFSVSFWFNSPTTLDQDCWFGLYYNNNDFLGVLGNGNETAYLQIVSSGGTPYNGSVTTTNAHTPDTWSHCCIVCTSSTERHVILNGNWANRGGGTGQTAAVFGNNPNAVYVGKFNPGFGSNVDALIAHVAVWDASLSQAQVEALAAGANPLAVQNSNLISYWPLAGTASPEPDEKGSYDLTLYNTPPQGASAPAVDDIPISTGPAVYAAGEYQWNVPAADVAKITDRSAVRVAVYSV